MAYTAQQFTDLGTDYSALIDNLKLINQRAAGNASAITLAAARQAHDDAVSLLSRMQSLTSHIETLVDGLEVRVYVDLAASKEP